MVDNITVLDSSAVEQTVKTTSTGDIHTPHHNVDSSALPDGAATELTLLAIATDIAATNDATQAADAASTTTDTGTVVLAVRQGAPRNSSDAEGDYETLRINDGRLLTSAEAPSTDALLAQLIRSVDANSRIMLAAYNMSDELQAFLDMGDQ